MANYLIMTTQWDQQRKRQAGIITLATAVALALLFFLVKWPVPTIPTPIPEAYVELELADVNLGAGEIGSGNDQPQIPGEPAPAAQAVSQPTTSTTSGGDASAVATDDNAPSDAPTVRNPTVPNPNSNKVDAATSSPKPSPAPPAPPAPRPRAVMGQIKGGNGPGGNGADTYKPGTGEGPGNGPGDAGTPGGNPKGTVYNDRQIVKQYYFQSELPPATVKAELTIDKNGKASLRRILNGSMSKYRNEIERYLPRMDFNKSDHESVVVFTFNFRT